MKPVDDEVIKVIQELLNIVKERAYLQKPITVRWY
jgi:hypothetical protein